MLLMVMVTTSAQPDETSIARSVEADRSEGLCIVMLVRGVAAMLQETERVTKRKETELLFALEFVGSTYESCPWVTADGDLYILYCLAQQQHQDAPALVRFSSS